MGQAGTTRFFSRIRRYFKSKFAGRYFSVILAELARIEPNAFLQIIEAAKLTLPERYIDALKSGGLNISLEWRFPGKQKRADLVLHVEENVPIVLIEIKVEDELRKGQLNAYLSLVANGINNSKRNGSDRLPCFLLISRYPLKESADINAVASAFKKKMPVAELRAGRLHQILRSHDGTVTRMLLEYLEDVGMTYQTVDLKHERNSLIHMAYKMIGMDGARQGRIRSHSSIEAIPNLMSQLLGNVEVLATWLYTERRSSFGSQRFRRDFEIEREEENGSIVGGEVSFYASGSFDCPKQKWARLYIGYSVGMKPTPYYGMFAEFLWGGGSNICWYDRAHYTGFKSFPDESEAIEMLRRLLKSARTKAIRSSVPPYREIFERLKEL